jgi:hypothetical protein
VLLIEETTDFKNFLERELLVTRKLLHQGLLVTMLMSLHRTFCARHHHLQLVKCDGLSVSQKNNNISASQSQSRPPYSVSLLITRSHICCWICWPFRNTWVHPLFISVCVALSFVFGVLFFRLLFVKLSFLLWSFYSRSVFSLWRLVTPFVSSNFSIKQTFM